MIRVERERVAKPEFFDSPEWRRLWEELADFHRHGGTRETQRTLPWRKLLSQFADRFEEELQELFSGKCAYTEQPMLSDFGRATKRAPRSLVELLHLHRPEADARDLDGTVHPDHYWWLILEWNNWYLASPPVVQARGSGFPVVGDRMEGPTFGPDGPGSTSVEDWLDGSSERSLDEGVLLDPCNDEPAWYLRFDDKGFVESRRNPDPDVAARFAGVDRGDTTIRLLDLNARHLVEERQSALERTAGALAEAASSVDRVADCIGSAAAYAGACRQMVARHLLRRGADLPTQAQEHLSDLVRPELAALLIESRPDAAPATPDLMGEMVRSYLSSSPPGLSDLVTTLDFALPTATLPSTGIEPPDEAPPPRQASSRRPRTHREARITCVTIRNFRAIHEVKLDLDNVPSEEQALVLEPEYRRRNVESSKTATRWWVLLGENGSGKSSVLQAIGLALAGGNLTQVMADADLKWDDLLRWETDDGQILVEFSDESRIDLRFDAHGHRWGDATTGSGAAPDLHIPVRGYGATRLLAAATDSDLTRDRVRVGNLFNPATEVIDAGSWLLGLDEGDFNVVASTISWLLNADRPADADSAPLDSPRVPITRDLENGRVAVDGIPLKLASDGYRAVIAIACDIMAGLGEGLSRMDNAVGIVLIDEIGAHLHPGWRMRITSRLRWILPGVQFIVSTHEPLCLRGLFAREVIRVHKMDQLGVVLEELDRSPRDYRVDQLLTSEFFGLNTTVDLDLDERFHDYYRLLAEPTLTAKQQAHLDELAAFLERRSKPVLGHTRRDQLVYEAIDRYLSREITLDENAASADELLQGRKQRRAAVIAEVREIWDQRRRLHPRLDAAGDSTDGADRSSGDAP